MKRLLISVPTGNYGRYQQELAWWLSAVQVHSAVREFGNAIADELLTDLRDRMAVRDAASNYCCAWSAEQIEQQWVDATEIKDLWTPLIPDGWSVTFMPVVGAPLAANRNWQIRKFLFQRDHEHETLVNSTYDAILMLDDDVLPTGRHLELLIDAISRDDIDVVGGVYCQEHPEGPQPLVYEMCDDPKKGFRYARGTLSMDGNLQKLESGGLPTGSLMVKRQVFQRIYEAGRPWFKDRLYDGSFESYELRDLLQRHDGDPAAAVAALEEQIKSRHEYDFPLHKVGAWHIGEDIWFCRMCTDLGIDMWVDTRVFMGHVKTHDARLEFKRREADGRRMFVVGSRTANPALDESDADALFEKTMAEAAATLREDEE